MAPEPEEIEIRYSFTMARRAPEVITVVLDARTMERRARPSQALPDWTALDFHRCPNCPLDVAVSPRCPVAVSLVEVVDRFKGVVSYDKVSLEVATAERTISQHTTAQDAVSSLVGLLFSTSGCPHAAFFKPMARFHLPLASGVETLYRAAGMYLLAQYLRRLDGLVSDPGLDGLNAIYRDMHTINVSVARRLRAATDTDSPINAIVLLDVFSQVLPYVIKDRLGEISPLFSAYLGPDLDGV